jgi:hypothetical protein
MKELINRFGFVREIKKDAEETRTVEFVISNGTKDRHGTVLNPDGWSLNNYKLNPIVGYQHNVYSTYNPNPDSIIGSGDAYTEKKELIGKVKFEPEKINPLAEKIFQKVLIGTLRATSVGFIPVGKGNYGKDSEGPGEANETYYYAGQELLEFSIVNVPSNPKATKRVIFEQFGRILLEYFKKEELEKMTIAELFQYSELTEKEEKKNLVAIEQFKLMKMQIDLLNL